MLADALLAWFDANKRDLPWRRTGDPYRIWVSEVMLQQTQVDRVIDYYERFLRAFPTVEDLAEASEAELLGLWEGLGYYSRARHMLAAARTIVEEHGGEFPRTVEQARALPGVGEYTAGAVLSIAFGVPAPAVDANVIRVLARLFAVEGDVSGGEPRRRVGDYAAALVPETRPGDFNQALMELGALLCTAGRPGCLLCPLTERCAARARGLQGQIPPPKSRAVQEVAEVAGVVRDADGRVLAARRPASGQWGGLWEFPSAVIGDDDPAEDVLRSRLARDFGIEVAIADEVASFSYGVMNRRVALKVLACRLVSGEAASREHDEVRWIRVEDLAEVAMPSPHRTVAQMLGEGDS